MKTNTTCPIWGTPALESPSFGKDGRFMDSPRAGGKYYIEGTAAEVLKHRHDSVKICLTSWLVEQRRLGNERPEIYFTTISDAQQRRDMSISARSDGILRYLEGKSNVLGIVIDYNIQYDISEKQTLNSYDLAYYELLAHSACLEDGDLSFLLNYLNEINFIEEFNNGPTGRGCLLTVKGYERLASLDAINADSSRAFVAMWFHPSMDDAWKKGFKPAIIEAGYDPVRVDKTEHINKIDDQIISEIRRSRFVVADFTHGHEGARGGVYYEAGFAYGLDIRVIFTCREGMLKKIHFDTRQFNHIEWKDPVDLREKLTTRIAAVIGDGPLLRT